MASPLIGVVAPRAFGFIPAVLGIIACIEYFIYAKKLPKINKFLLLFIIGFLIFAGSSYFWAIRPSTVLDRIIKLSLLVIPSLFLLFTAHSATIIKKEYLKFLPYSLICASILLSIETYFNYPLYRLLHGITVENTVAPAVINRALIVICVLLWPTLYKLWTEKNIIITAILIITTSLAISLSVCQSAMIALIFGALTLLISTQRPKALLYIIGAGIIIGIFSSPWIAQYLFDLRPEILMNWTGANAAQRIELWDFVARKALESPWYGWGIESTRHIDNFDSAKIFYSTTRIIHPHNFALQLWIELGILGALSGAAFIMLCIKNILIINKKQLPFIIAGFTTILIINLVGYGIWQGWLVGIEFMTILIFIVMRKQYEEIK